MAVPGPSSVHVADPRPEARADAHSDKPHARRPHARRPQASPRPPALDWSVENCTVYRAMEILGERWTLVVLREIFNGVRRFDQMREHTDIPRQVLTNRLAMLVEQGLLRRAPYQEPGERVRHEYKLTGKGFEIYPILVAVREWGDRYLADPEGSPVEMAHRSCGEVVQTKLVCAAGHEIDELREVVTRPGPGARLRVSATRPD